MNMDKQESSNPDRQACEAEFANLATRLEQVGKRVSPGYVALAAAHLLREGLDEDTIQQVAIERTGVDPFTMPE